MPAGDHLQHGGSPHDEVELHGCYPFERKVRRISPSSLMGVAPDLIRGDGRPTLFRDPHTRGPVLCEASAEEYRSYQDGNQRALMTPLFVATVHRPP